MTDATSRSSAERERQLALDALHIVGSLPEPAYEDIVKVAAAVCGTPMALVTLIDRDRQWFKARTGVDGSQTERNVAVCDHAIREPDRLMEIGDLQRDSRFVDNPVLKELGARFYAGMPLVTAEGSPIGSVCVVDLQPRELNPAQRDALKALARLTMALMEARSREREHVVSEILNQSLEAGPVAEDAAVCAAAAGYTVVIIELQDMDALVACHGERGLDRHLQALDQKLDACLDAHRGDSINRVTGSGEFIAVLGVPEAPETLQALQAVAAEVRHTLQAQLLIGSAATHSGEPTSQVFQRAEQSLSQAKDAV